MIMNYILLLFNALVLGERLTLSGGEMSATASTTYCTDMGFQPWYIGCNSGLLCALSALLKSHALTTAWIGSRPHWLASQGVEFVVLEDSKVSFGRIYETSDESIMKRTVCIICNDKPTPSDTNEKISNPDVTQERLLPQTAADKTCCNII